MEDDIFMSQPLGFEKRLGERKVCRLKKPLYGLKQSSRAWFEQFGKAVKGHWYTQSQVDHTIFYKHSKEGKIVIFIVYVDDIILIGDEGEAFHLRLGLGIWDFDVFWKGWKCTVEMKSWQGGTSLGRRVRESSSWRGVQMRQGGFCFELLWRRRQKGFH